VPASSQQSPLALQAREGLLGRFSPGGGSASRVFESEQLAAAAAAARADAPLADSAYTALWAPFDPAARAGVLRASQKEASSAAAAAGEQARRGSRAAVSFNIPPAEAAGLGARANAPGLYGADAGDLSGGNPSYEGAGGGHLPAGQQAAGAPASEAVSEVDGRDAELCILRLRLLCCSCARSPHQSHLSSSRCTHSLHPQLPRILFRPT
jgi:hypothetical protein